MLVGDAGVDGWGGCRWGGNITGVAGRLSLALEGGIHAHGSGLEEVRIDLAYSEIYGS